MSFGLPESTLQTLHEILARHAQVERAVLYGSRAKGTYRTGSDIDLTLIGRDLSHNDLLAIMAEFHESPIPYVVDLSIFDDIQDQAVRDHILGRGRVFYQRLT